MADYWISQNRKYCDFCKCWITDNKPSVDSHEKGRRHQANVQKKIRTIQRQSAQNEREAQRYDATIQHMESAALNAYRKDVKNNADYTSLAINRKVEQENLTISSGGGSGSKKIWNEAIDNNGKTYYYNIMNYERVTKPPREGYCSLKEQQEQADLDSKRQMQILDKYQRTEGMLRQQQVDKEEMEIRARIAREKMKERCVTNDDASATVTGPLLEPGRTNPYGRWETIKEEVHVDLQLPQQQDYYEPPVEYVPEPVVREFKEKTIERLDGAGGETSFRKRKIGNGIKRNTRQRLDDD